MSHSKWNAVNTPLSQKLDDEIIAKMTLVAHLHYKIATPADATVVDALSIMTDVFLLEKETEFKYGKGKKVVAITDGGKNSAGNTVKYVKWYNLYETADRQDGLSPRSLKVLDKTYTYGVEKARVFWNEKIKEGYNRVI